MADNQGHIVDICNGNEAADFVESVMNSQRCSRVTATPGGRKRSASESDQIEDLDTTTKKARHTSKRSLLLNGPTPAPRKVVVAEADVHIDGNPSIEHLITKLSADMHMLFSSLSERMDKLESGLEQRIANKVSQLLDKRVNSELSRIRRDIDDKLDSFQESIRTDIAEELDEINVKVKSLSTADQSDKVDITRNIVVRGLPELQSENTTNKINSLIKDGLKIKGVTCARAERKPSNNSSKPGIVIATMKSHDDKRKVMTNKTELNSSKQYSSVYINHDQSQADRVMSGNFRTILSALKHHGLEVRGSRVVRKRQNEANERTDDQSRDQDRRRQFGNERQQSYNGRSGNYRGNGNRGNRNYSNADNRGSSRGQGPRRY